MYREEEGIVQGSGIASPRQSVRVDRAILCGEGDGKCTDLGEIIQVKAVDEFVIDHLQKFPSFECLGVVPPYFF